MDLEIHYNVYGCFREPRADVELAKRAVDAGFEGIWIGDHFMPWLDSRPYTHHVFPWFGTLLSEVPDVPVGTSVTCPMFRYHPPVLAQAVATLDNMYPGRLQLGVGVGQALNEAHFVDDYPDWHTRADMLVETIELFDRLWNSEKFVRHKGEYFDYDAMKLYTRPKADIPIHWAGWGPTSCQYAGKHADHIITSAGADLIENRVVPAFEDGREDSDRSGGDVTAELAVNIGDPAELVATLRDRGEHIPGGERYNRDPRAIQRAAENELETMSDEELRDMNTITEDPDDVVEALRRYEEAGATRVLVGTNVGDPKATIETFESEIFPRLD